MSAEVRPPLTRERLVELLRYVPETGEFIWLVTRGAKAGNRAGAIDVYGYRVIRVDWTLYRACRLAWFYMHGEWPAEQVDHINMDRADDRISNLRLATNGQNTMNRRVRSDNRSGLKGAFYEARRGKWSASITANGVTTRLGYFDSAMDAHKAYARAAVKLHGEFARI